MVFLAKVDLVLLTSFGIIKVKCSCLNVNLAILVLLTQMSMWSIEHSLIS